MAYEINININGDIEGLGTNSSGVSDKPTATEQEKAMKSLGKFVASQTIQPFIQNIKTAVSQNVGTITGQTELQQRINFGMEVVQYGVNTYKNAQAGALIGTSMGIGGATGAIIGVALTALNTMMTISFTRYQLQLEEHMENYQIQQARSRQGIAFNRSRTGA
jgi:hypothetical protein